MKRGRKPFNIQLLVDRGLFPENWRDKILNLGRQGKNKIHYAVELGIARNTLYRLMERSPEFLSTINEALELSEKWFLDIALNKWEEDAGKGLNTTFMKYYLQNTYRNSGWVDQTDITTDGKPISQDNKDITVKIIKPTNEEEDDNS